jgi:hypothetical protein
MRSCHVNTAVEEGRSRIMEHRTSEREGTAPGGKLEAAGVRREEIANLFFFS